ncbi:MULTISPECIES: hypothetical protein [unclassified Lentimonas]|uniref:hypothetical protein n=1 Tax=unclassified Lentimonas TaxID=2630993 RepID=UPI0013236AA0|nr:MULTISPECIES: hypothetical protein [unclassified Lentimonas]CAA6692396.1 Unannotated [Lentimonas sp. CC19]CAA6693968.1 Unannotated [Lentimonas sp. CC10]CAA7072214.1 Unannotated [Lentimonas sp. CC11]
MSKDYKPLQVAILISTAGDWGRRLIRGIIRYSNEIGAWDLWVKDHTQQFVNHLPQDWSGDGIITPVINTSHTHQPRS